MHYYLKTYFNLKKKKNVMLRVFVRFLYRYRVRAMYGHLIISPIYCDRGTIIFSGMIMVYENLTPVTFGWGDNQGFSFIHLALCI